MDAIEFLDSLRARGADLVQHEGALRYRGPEGVLTDSLRTYVHRHRDELLPLARPACRGPHWTDRLPRAERSRLARAVRRARRGGYARLHVPDADRPDIVLVDPNAAILTAMRIRRLPLLTAVAGILDGSGRIDCDSRNEGQP